MPARCCRFPNRWEQSVAGNLRQRVLKGAVSRGVLAKAEGNILTNLSPAAQTRYHQEVLSMPLLIAPVLSLADREAVAPITGEKDAHVLAAALSIGADFLLTLDKRLASRIMEAQERSIHTLSPGEFITTHLPTHPAYPSMRPE